MILPAEFQDNKYRRWYFTIITKARTFPRRKRRKNGRYFERHHVLPKSLGGNNNCTNLVLLTQREHFLCHWLLTKFTVGHANQKMQFALGCMVQGSPNQPGLTPAQFTRAVKAKIGIGYKKTPEQIERMIEIRLASEAVKRHMDWLHTDPGVREKKRTKMRITAASPEGIAHQKLLVEARKLKFGYPKDHTCERCGKTTTQNIYTRWHGPKCTGTRGIRKRNRKPRILKPKIIKRSVSQAAKDFWDHQRAEAAAGRPSRAIQGFPGEKPQREKGIKYRHSIEVIEKIKANNIRTHISRAEKVRQFQKGRARSEEYRKNLSEGAKRGWIKRKRK